mmetsp:Transcript_32590/g.76792  ORF Transcript_32590/g.76792 Transcript_32590/m.76792 type:complete len:284 (+) Transcript_32590:534-1385(+)
MGFHKIEHVIIDGRPQERILVKAHNILVRTSTGLSVILKESPYVDSIPVHHLSITFREKRVSIPLIRIVSTVPTWTLPVRRVVEIYEGKSFSETRTEFLFNQIHIILGKIGSVKDDDICIVLVIVQRKIVGIHKFQRLQKNTKAVSVVTRVTFLSQVHDCVSLAFAILIAVDNLHIFFYGGFLKVRVLLRIRCCKCLTTRSLKNSFDQRVELHGTQSIGIFQVHTLVMKIHIEVNSGFRDCTITMQQKLTLRHGENINESFRVHAVMFFEHVGWQFPRRSYNK